MNNVGKKENTRRSALTKHYEIMCCHANDSILLIDQNLKIVECNERAAETYGYCSEDLIGMEIKMLRPDRYREEIEPTLRNSEKEDGIIYETVNQRKDGSTFPAEVSARPIKINDAEYYQIIIRDISERKKAERKIQESENRFKELFENMSSCVAVYEAVGDGDDFMFADFNKAAERVEKIRKEDIIGKSVLEVFPGIREFGLFEVFQRVRRTGIAEFKPAAFYKDGRVGGWKQNYVYKLPSGEVVAIYDDVTDKKLAEESLQKSEGLYRTIFEHTGTAMAIIKEDIFLMVNSEFEVLSGYKKEDLESKKTWMECVSPGYLAWLIKEKKRLETADYNICVHHEFRFRDRWGHVKYCILNAALIPGTTKIAASFLDVTDRRQAEQNLKETGRLLEAIIKSAPLAILVIDNDDKVSLWNPAAEAMFGWNEQEIIKRKIPIIPENKDAEYEYIRETVRSGQMVKSMKTQRAKKDGSLIDVSLSVAPLMDADGKMIGRMGIFADISESLRAERRLRENEEKYRNIFENIQDVYFEVDMNGIVQEASPSIEFEMGYMREELIGRPASDLYLRDEEKKSFLKIIHQEGQIRDYEAHLRHKNQAVLVCSLNGKLAYEDNGNLVGFIISLRNVTKRKTAEDALRRAEEKYRSIVENAVEGIIQISPDGRFLSANQAFADMLGYDSPEELMTTITNIADQLIVDPQDVIRFVEQKEKDLIVKGFETRLYRKDGSALWILFNNRAVSDADDKLLYEENFCQDITSRKTAEERLQETLQSLRNALSTTIQAMIAAVESKDPYTAGHQLRSADLSCAIARELGLSEEKIEAIHMAGSIHDIGKLSIPSELLTKPTKLTDLEFRLVKEHARRGYDILKEVGHDCLLAETIHQHHERINGSGYPRGLTGSKILLDARILMVADVVESMASHRPYRAALGIQAALEEIEKNRGILYDADVVDACLRLFREKGFQLKESDELPILS